MAAVASNQLHTKSTPRATSSVEIPSLRATELMTSIMSYQYPPLPPPNGTEIDVPPPGYMPSYGVPQPPVSAIDMRPGHEPPMSLKDRKDSLSQASLKIKRSWSTPNVRSQQNASDHLPMGMSSSDKRRNKLGYHRTSVACGHCRRRKIRCIPSPADVQGRCVNCIRLKKECSFFPVDQQPPPPDTRSKGSSRSSTAPKIASASSSPAIPSGHPADSHQPYPPLAMPPIQHMPPPGVKASGTDPFSPDAKLPTSASSSGRAFDFPSQGMTNWMPAEHSPNPAAKPSDMGGAWRGYPQESPITPSFSPYTPHAPSSAGWNGPVSAESAPREDLPWPPYPLPPRSMSFGGETLGSHTPGPYSPAQGRQYERKASTMSSDVYPSSIATSVSGVDTAPSGPTMEHNVSLSAGAVPSSGYGTWQQPYHYAKPGEAYGSWGYGENGSSAPGATEEQIPPPTETQAPPANMYYPPR
ncbi:uncharacterized protein DNG_00517 [Cephalotrichum gorgonifer]|uniref:Zn(2)-C6 fungal-type domain-containing protein n=1 Tax=Cephalotrichum gorgonifer TaxID=2041049 RepID=A0AAE8SRA1_9PEZI|nr:uncharacterized protein DNG_00517 [Cephalotrichum gorgonifer]